MAGKPPNTTSLKTLHSSEELSLLNSIDSLRSQGISDYISLPQLIVCGDQSSGKSSVLEAISSIPFPTKDKLCTRFATEIILRRTLTTKVSVRIDPSSTRSEADKERLLKFQGTLDSFEDLPNLLEKASDEMGISSSISFSSDALRVEISGPALPYLTIVDLPGLIHTETGGQRKTDPELVKELVEKYMRDRRSIILAIISAKNDISNQIVLKMAKDADPKGLRTMGVITKPDTLPVESESELSFANLARNEDIKFRLGWHVLKNRDYAERGSNIEARDLAETEFFAQGIWEDFPRDLVGITTLRPRLSKVLLAQIKGELPSLVAEIENSADDCRSKIKKLGDSRADVEEQRLYLLNISQSFGSLVKAAGDGSYGDEFFGDPHSTDGYAKHLRAVIQNLNLNFAEVMRVRGHRRQITTVASEVPKSIFGNTQIVNSFSNPKYITRTDFIDDIQGLLKRGRGRELPGLFNPLLVGDLFHDQSGPWDIIAKQHIQDCLGATRTFLELTISHLADEDASEALLKEITDPLLEDLAIKLEEKLIEILASYRNVHAITYNHYFTESIQSARQKRQGEEIKSKITPLLKSEGLFNPKKDLQGVEISDIVSALTMHSEADMDRYACSEILDCMEAYYKVRARRNLSLPHSIMNLTNLRVIGSNENGCR